MRFPFAGLAFMHQLARINARHRSKGDAICKRHTWRREQRTFSTNAAKRGQNEGDESGSSSPLSAEQLSARRMLLSRGRRSLSPLERISGLLPQDALGPEVMQLRDQNQEGPAQVSGVRASGSAEDDPERRHLSDAAEDPNTSEASHEEDRPPTLPGERLLQLGELLVAEYRRNRKVDFRKMFQLQPGARLMSSWGVILHDDVVGQPAGRFLKTSRGFRILVRRASLEDYVLYMKRGPAIAYPKVRISLWLVGVKKRRPYGYLPLSPGCCHHAADDGCHRWRQRVGVRLRIRGNVPVPVQSRWLTLHPKITYFRM